MSNRGCTDIDTMRAKFPAMPERRGGRPDLMYLLYPALRHICDCAISHRVHNRPLGLLYIAVRQPTYALHTAQPYPARAGNPGESETYQPNDGPVARKTIENEFN